MIKIPFTMERSALRLLLDTWGKAYLLGAEVRPGDTLAAPALDCSELAERVYNDELRIPLPDGAHYQYLFCKSAGLQLGPEEAPRPLDLVFLWDRDSIGGHIGHIALVLGELGPVGGAILIEARGRPYGHIILTPLEAFTRHFGARVAGIFRLIEVQDLPAPV